MPEMRGPEMEPVSARSNKQCARCGASIPPIRAANARTRYCSTSCSRKAETERRHANSGYLDLPAGTVGAIHEMVAATDLMRRGYHVFRALSPSCPCDLLAYKDGTKPIRVEVRTATRRPDGTMYYLQPKKDEGQQDVFAFVAHDGEIRYIPGLSEAE